MSLQFSIKLSQEIGQLIGQEMIRLVQQEGIDNIADIEEGLRRSLHEIGRESLQATLAHWEEPYPEPTRPCPYCNQTAEYERRREAKTLTVFGWVTYRRAYYLCPHCHKGHSPVDLRLGLQPGAVSAGLAPLLALLGIQTSFAESSDKLAEEILLIDVSDNTVRKETQQMGELQAEIEQEQQQACQTANLHQERAQANQHRPQRIYGSLDGVMAPIDKEWHELKVGVWYSVQQHQPTRSPTVIGQQPELKATAISYYCDTCTAADFSPQFWTTGYQRQAHLAEEVVFVADGAVWIWKLVEANFPQATQIADWYHAVEYLPPIAKAAFADPDQRAQWLAERRQELWNGLIDPLITACEDLQSHPMAGSHAATAATYFFNNKARMDYARFRAAGYQIGSGPMESGCKQIASLRLKRPGARWSETGARLTAKARAAWLSGPSEWEALKLRRKQLAQLPLAV
jgi:hypothetical protein